MRKAEDSIGETDRPLAGLRIAVTRPKEQSAELITGLERLGARVLAMPTIRIEPASDPAPLRKAAGRVGDFDWIVFTSANGVRHFWTALREGGLDTSALAGVAICAIGRVTAEAVEREGGRVDLMPDEYVAEGLIEAMTARGSLDGKRVLLARAEVARGVLPDALDAAGAEVTDVAAYRTVPDLSSTELLRAAASTGEIDVVTFTSSSTVRNFADVTGGSLGNAVAASIGPITSATIRELGWPVTIEAQDHSAAGLVAAIAAHFAGASR
jgi:uroporphyrinogen III methyltransferase / synthase